MGYSMKSGRWADTEEVVLAALVARTADGQGVARELGDRGTLRAKLTCTDASGTDESLAVKIETSEDGATWRELAAFTVLSAPGSQRISVPGCDRFVRASWDVGGTTPSFTFRVDGEAV